MKRSTVIAIQDDGFLINGQPTYAGRWFSAENNGRWRKIEGLLLNSRMVQGIFDDLNPETQGRWAYPDGPWDPDRNTREFIAAMPDWRAAGLLSFTINLQGGSPEGYSPFQPWHNSAFDAAGDLREPYMARLEQILDAADSLGMAPILGYFYFGQDERLRDESAICRATDNATDWLLDKGYTNVLIEIGNEVNNRSYEHDLIRAARCHELIERVQRRSEGKVAAPARRLLVSASFNGNTLPTENVIAVSDYILMHGNGVSEPVRIREMIDICRTLPAYRGQPIVFNEDDHFAFEAADNNMLAALDRYASWGYFDFRMAGEGYDEGYQSVPVNWGISSERKRGFFDLLARVTVSHQ